jgi:hypothetical protein
MGVLPGTSCVKITFEPLLYFCENNFTHLGPTPKAMNDTYSHPQATQLLLVENEEVIETLAAQAAHETLAKRVSPRRTPTQATKQLFHK